MPNHCENELTVSSEWKKDNYHKEELRQFMEEVKESSPWEPESPRGFSYDSIIPYPRVFRERDIEVEKLRQEYNKKYKEAKEKGGLLPDYPKEKDGYNQGGYEWCCDNWGTKWDTYDLKVNIDNLEYGYINYTFQSAWNPPLPVIYAASLKFPHLKFMLEYWEAGAGFQGTYIVKNGEVKVNDRFNYYGKKGG